MSEDQNERLMQGFKTAATLFAAAPEIPRFEVPPEIAAEWNTFSVSTVMGDLWSRPGLEMRDRAMITLAALTVLNRPDQLRVYIHGALGVGVTRSEVCEVIMHMATYAGFPAAIEAFRVADSAFKEQDAAAAEKEAT
jgi:4-carboxymuconolactone decarboxylase